MHETASLILSLPSTSSPASETWLTTSGSESMGSSARFRWPQPGRRGLVCRLLHASTNIKLTATEIRDIVRMISCLPQPNLILETVCPLSEGQRCGGVIDLRTMSSGDSIRTMHSYTHTHVTPTICGYCEIYFAAGAYAVCA